MSNSLKNSPHSKGKRKGGSASVTSDSSSKHNPPSPLASSGGGRDVADELPAVQYSPSQSPPGDAAAMDVPLSRVEAKLSSPRRSEDTTRHPSSPPQPHSGPANLSSGDDDTASARPGSSAMAGPLAEDNQSSSGRWVSALASPTEEAPGEKVSAASEDGEDQAETSSGCCNAKSLAEPGELAEEGSASSVVKKKKKKKKRNKNAAAATNAANMNMNMNTANNTANGTGSDNMEGLGPHHNMPPGINRNVMGNNMHNNNNNNNNNMNNSAMGYGPIPDMHLLHGGMGPPHTQGPPMGPPPNLPMGYGGPGPSRQAMPVLMPALLPAPVAAPPHPLCFTPEVRPALSRLVEREVLAYLMPSLTALNRRRDQLWCLAQHLTEAIHICGDAQGRHYGTVRFFMFGSVNMRTVLPEGDNDITVEVDGLLSEEAQQAATAAASTPLKSGPTQPLTTESSYGNKEGTLQLTTTVEGKPLLAPPPAISVPAGDLLARVRDHLVATKSPLYVEALVVAEVRVLKLAMEGSSYDITISQFGGVNCVRFLHEMDAAIGGQHLLKSTLLLLKSWCCYEAHVLGGQGGYIGSYAATVMLVSMLNTVEFLEDVEPAAGPAQGAGKGSGGSEGTAAAAADGKGRPSVVAEGLSPLVLLCRFLKFYRYFDYDTYCVTAFGPLRLTSISSTPYDLSKLEVPAASNLPVGGAAAAATAGPGVAGGDEAVDTNNLGLTEEGQAAIGHLIRRRQKPFLTVSGVRHLLDEMNTTRMTEREQWYQQQYGQEGAPPPAPAARTDLSRRGNSVEDANLVSPSCNTCVFPVRCMNVLDPLRWSSNMVRGVCRNHLQRIIRAFDEGLRMFAAASAELEAARPPPAPPTTSPATISRGSRASSTCSGEVNHGAAYGPSYAEAPPGMQYYPDEIVPGYPAPHSQCTVHEVNVLQYLFENTIHCIQKNSMVNCPWHREESAPGVPQCRTCARPSFFCAPRIACMCEPQCVFLNRPVADGELAELRRHGPLGEEVVPPLPAVPAPSAPLPPPHGGVWGQPMGMYSPTMMRGGGYGGDYNVSPTHHNRGRGGGNAFPAFPQQSPPPPRMSPVSNGYYGGKAMRYPPPPEPGPPSLSRGGMILGRGSAYAKNGRGNGRGMNHNNNNNNTNNNNGYPPPLKDPHHTSPKDVNTSASVDV